MPDRSEDDPRRRDSRESAEPGPTEPGPRRVSRRRALQWGLGALALLAPRSSEGASRFLGPADEMLRRSIPSSGEEIPVVGLGTWQTFDVGGDREEREALRRVLRLFVELGGSVVDSSPMYGSSQLVLGDLATDLELLDELWVATKVWIEGREAGVEQMEESLSELRRSRIELMQVHNLVDVDRHMDTLEAWKDRGRIRYIGVTTSSSRQYPRMEAVMDDERLDFIQVNYSMAERQSAERILPKARERGLAVMINRPFAGGRLFRRLGDEPLPSWASEIDASAWSQVFLKYVLSHPAVTVAIPATSDPQHLRENMGGGVGRMPDQGLRRRMEALVAG